MSLESLAVILGVSAKQVQKYETGNDQLFPSRLQQIARALDVPIEHFFDANVGSNISISELLNQPDMVRLALAFCRIKRMGLRNGVFDLIQSVSE